MTSITTMIESASILLLAVLAVASLRNRFVERRLLRGALLGGLFALVGLVVMNNSVEVVPGIRTDPRAAVVALSAAFGGPLSVLITAPCLAFARYLYGGVGAVPGIYYILGTGLTGALAWIWWFRIARRRLSIRYVLLQAAIAGFAPPVILLFVSAAPWGVFLISNGLALPTNFFAALVMGTMILRDQEHKDALAAQGETQARIDTIANNAPAILFQMTRDPDAGPKFLYVSNVAERILGVQPDTLTARFDAFTALFDPANAAEIGRQLEASAGSMSPWMLELECTRSDGGVVWIRIDAGPRCDLNDRIVWDGTISDVTEQKNAERMKDEFISTVSHELRTPLTSIRGSLGLVFGSGADQIPPKITRMLEIANRNAERLVLLINDILDIQKIRLGQMTFHCSDEPLRPLLDQAIVAAQGYMPEKAMRIVLTDDATDSCAPIDPDRMGQVLANLMSNAIKFSPARSTIHLSMRRDASTLRISVHDEGPGIPVEFRSRIFDRFSQAETSSTRPVGGTGLGLNISKAIVEAMRGNLSFETSDNGTTFHIDLPALDAIPGPAWNDATQPDTPHVLICGTDPQLNQTFGKALGCDRIATDVAPDVRAALDLVAERTYGAMLVDLSAVPSLDLFQQLRSNARTRDLPVIIVSGEMAERSEMFAGAAVDVIDWLEKPLDVGSLKSALETALATNDSTRPHILYVEDDHCLQEVIRQNLENKARITGAASITAARAHLDAGTFDLILLDLDLPDGSGVELLHTLPDQVPVIIFSAFDVGPEFHSRAVSVLTKSRVREVDVAKTVLATLSKDAARGRPQPKVA